MLFCPYLSSGSIAFALWVRRKRHRATNSTHHPGADESPYTKPELDAKTDRYEMGDNQESHELAADQVKHELDGAGDAAGRNGHATRCNVQELRGQESSHEMEAQPKEM